MRMGSKENFQREVLKLVKTKQLTPQTASVLLNCKDESNDDGHDPKKIAVIGLSCAFPGAKDAIDYWDNIKNGVNSVTDFEARWDKGKYYSQDVREPGKTNITSGGFLDDIYDFDPEYFNITPKEAILMDPQQRLFLMHAVKTFEDAGYALDQLNDKKCGVFVGVRQGDYQDIVRKDVSNINPGLLTGNSSALLAARISYYLNLTGPSIAIDTACSSSLVAIEDAVVNLQNEDMDMALAGGVSLYCTPEMHVMTSKGHMLSEDGACKTFDNAANGFVLSEGVGCVLLKPLEKAVKDGDHIYGVITGWGKNQDGKTNGITAPCMRSQYELECSVYDRFHINPQDISYVEFHGTGTKLGDPIELTALDKAFREYTKEKQFCAIGSVKMNIGHTLAASGVASLIKVLLCMEHKKLVPAIHQVQKNENFNFDDSPFYVNQEYKDWNTNGKNRIAAISSFGLSGTNCHIVIEEYKEDKVPEQAVQEPQMCFLSAKTKVGLNNNVAALAKWMKAEQGYGIRDICYTLAYGRRTEKERVAFVVSSVEQLRENLQAFLQGEKRPGTFLSSSEDKQVDKQKQSALKEYLVTQIQKENMDLEMQTKIKFAIAQCFVDGVDFDANRIFPYCKTRRANILSDGFELRTLVANVDCAKEESDSTGKEKQEWLHPLIASNTSTFSNYSFETFFTGKEFFAADHKVCQEPVVPGVVYLEMALASAEYLCGEKASVLKNISWYKKAALCGEPKKFSIKLEKNQKNVTAKIYSEERDGLRELNSTVDVSFEQFAENKKLSIPDIMNRLSRKLTQEQIYGFYGKHGISYEKKMMSLDQIYAGDRECIGVLNDVWKEESTAEEYTLSPAVLDGMVQSLVGIRRVSEVGDKTILPYRMGNVSIAGSLKNARYVYVQEMKENCFTIMCTDKEGNVLVQIDQYEIKELLTQQEKTEDELLYLIPVEKTQKMKQESDITTVVFSDKGFDENVPSNQILVQFGDDYSKIGVRQYQVNSLRIENYRTLFKELESLSVKKVVWRPSEGTRDVFSPVFMFTKYWLTEQGAKKLSFEIQRSRRKNLYLEAFDGFIKTIKIENPNLTISLTDEDGANYTETTLEERKAEKTSQPVFKQGGLYVITGGAGGLGCIFAEYIVHKVHGKVILIGRSPREAVQGKLERAGLNHLDVHYFSEDVTNYQAMSKLVSDIHKEFGSVNGVIQCVGVIHDDYMIRKSLDSAKEVIQCKIDSAIVLDKIFEQESLDFFAMFSAGASVFGNAGQSDYAYANSFLNKFAMYRDELVKQKKRFGVTKAIAWPLWSSDGMNVDERVEKNLYRTIGMKRMPKDIGVLSFMQCMNMEEPVVAVVYGDRGKIQGMIQQEEKQEKENVLTEVSDRELMDKTIDLIKDIFEKVIKTPKSRLSKSITFEELGIDSLIIIDINWELEQVFGSLPKTLLFEYHTIEQLAGYFMENEKEILNKKFAPSDITNEYVEIEFTDFKQDVNSIAETRQDESSIAHDDIAVIGISGRYPEADDLDTFWKNLKEGTDCIKEIPKERWDAEKYFNPDKNHKGTMYSKWGGFLSEIDLFDPLYFKIAPREAETMDPQERLFLEESYKAVADAGYTASSLKKYVTGVFAGVMYGHYQLFGADGKTDRVIGSSYANVANRVSYFFDFHGPSIALDTMCSSSLTTIHMACQSIKDGECEVALSGGVNISVHPNKYLLLCQDKFLSTDGRCRSFGEGGSGYVPGEGVGVVVLKKLSQAVKDNDNIYGIIKSSAVNHGGRSNGYSVPDPAMQAMVIQNALDKEQIDPDTISYIEAHGTGTSLGDPIEISGLEKVFGKSKGKRDRLDIGSVKSNIGHLESAAGIAAVTKTLLQMKHKKLVPSLHSKTLNPNIDFDHSIFQVVQQYKDWSPVMSDGTSLARRAGISAFGAGGTNTHLVLEESKVREYVPTDEKQLIVLSARDEKNLQAYVNKILNYVTLHAAKSAEQGSITDKIMEVTSKHLAIGVDQLDRELDLSEICNDTCRQFAILDELSDYYGIANDTTLRNDSMTIAALAEEIKKLGTKNVGEIYEYSDDTYAELTLQNIAYTLQVGREHFPYQIAFTANNMDEFLAKLRDYLQGNKQGILEGVLKEKADGVLEEVSENEMKALLLRGDWNKVAAQWLNGIDIPWDTLYENKKIQKVSLPAVPLIRKRYWFDSYRNAKPVSEIPVSETRKEETNTRSYVEVKPADIKKTEYVEEEFQDYNGNEVVLEIKEQHIAVVTIQDTKNRNTFSSEVIRGLKKRFDQIRHNKDVKVVIVTGDEHVFCMGGTEQQLVNISHGKSKFSDEPFLYKGLMEMDIPVISAMQGHASGGGMLFGLYADIVIMALEGVYSAVFMKYGFTPGMGGTYILQDRFGGNIATEMMFTAKSYTGEELKDRGASVLFRPSKDVLKEAMSIARMLSSKPYHSLCTLKKELAGRKLSQIDHYIDIEEDMHTKTFSGEEVQKRIDHYYFSDKKEGGIMQEPVKVQPKVERKVEPKEVIQEPKKRTHQDELNDLMMGNPVKYTEHDVYTWGLKSKSPKATNRPAANKTVAKEPKKTTCRTADRKQIIKRLENILHISEDDIRDDLTFRDMGMDSISGVEIVRDLNKEYGLVMDAVDLYDYPTIPELMAYMNEELAKNPVEESMDSQEVDEEEQEQNVVEQEEVPARPSDNGLKIVTEQVKQIAGNILHIEIDEFPDDVVFKDLGMDSISSVEIVRDINSYFHTNIDAVATYDYPDAVSMAEYLIKECEVQVEVQSAPTERVEKKEPVVKKESTFSPSGKSKLDLKQRNKSEAAAQNQNARRSGSKIVLGMGTDKPRRAESHSVTQKKQLNITRNVETPSQVHTERGIKVNLKQTEDTAKESAECHREEKKKHRKIAVIGMAGRFPGADNVDKYWNNLKNGVDSVTTVPEDRWDWEQYFDKNSRTPNKTYSTVGGFLEDTDCFDPMFFQISPMEAKTMDPQQRIFLQVVWNAIEDAGYSKEMIQGSNCGVFVGAAQGDYKQKIMGTDESNSAEAFVGMSPSVLPARISYILDLKGPCLAMDTACSSSLVAIHEACKSILTGESDMAIAGGVRLMFTPEMHIQTSKMEMLSFTGSVKAFDNDADGTVLSEGAGAIILKDYEQAVKDKDHIYGCILSSGVNQDGRTNGLTAPSAQSQSTLELSVYRKADINPEDITYVMAHGTGTKLGDPIEVKALKKAFGEFTDKKNFCTLGSVKTNIGHNTMAAGVSSVIAVLQAMKHKQIPPLIHFNELNGHINLEDSPFNIVTELKDWTPEEGKKRMAAISAFGFSGTNCHMVIEEADELDESCEEASKYDSSKR